MYHDRFIKIAYSILKRGQDNEYFVRAVKQNIIAKIGKIVEDLSVNTNFLIDELKYSANQLYTFISDFSNEEILSDENIVNCMSRIKSFLNECYYYLNMDMRDFQKRFTKIDLNIIYDIKGKIEELLEIFHKAEEKVSAKLKEIAEELDWRPAETIPEDYYAL